MWAELQIRKIKSENGSIDRLSFQAWYTFSTAFLERILRKQGICLLEWKEKILIIGFSAVVSQDNKSLYQSGLRTVKQWGFSKKKSKLKLCTVVFYESVKICYNCLYWVFMYLSWRLQWCLRILKLCVMKVLLSDSEFSAGVHCDQRKKLSPAWIFLGTSSEVFPHALRINNVNNTDANFPKSLCNEPQISRMQLLKIGT